MINLIIGLKYFINHKSILTALNRVTFFPEESVARAEKEQEQEHQNGVSRKSTRSEQQDNQQL